MESFYGFHMGRIRNTYNMYVYTIGYRINKAYKHPYLCNSRSGTSIFVKRIHLIGAIRDICNWVAAVIWLIYSTTATTTIAISVTTVDTLYWHHQYHHSLTPLLSLLQFCCTCWWYATQFQLTSPKNVHLFLVSTARIIYATRVKYLAFITNVNGRNYNDHNLAMTPLYAHHTFFITCTSKSVSDQVTTWPITALRL